MELEQHIQNLKQYIKDDEIIEKDGSDFANFCKSHCEDIQAVLEELETKSTCYNILKKEIQDKLEELIEYKFYILGTPETDKKDEILSKINIEIKILKELLNKE